MSTWPGSTSGLKQADLDWIARNVSLAHDLLPQIGVPASTSLAAASLDRLWAHLRSEEHDAGFVISVIGLAAGQLIADRYRLEWVEITDEHGTDVALRGPYGFVLFPKRVAAECYARNEPFFVEPLVYDVAQQLAD
jgi:hypothetical protein